ncbi:ATP-binding cassette sub-family D member 2 [Venturia nashicola]|uniref:Acyl-coenzyme A diphosphatase SCS3 n=1 Tax=Venturia nashicola TaxID=86259 RepID=A0A4Z1PAZ4_9PEZI|nr:ATP-binding cassette sub-family D member 2 [Venturia nashicola]
MATQRRHGSTDIPIPRSSAQPSNSNSRPKMRQPSETSPFLPTKLETALLAIYPITLILGSIFSSLSTSIPSTYSVAHQSYYPPSTAPSYFAKKKNIFNLYFVKRGWGWVTLSAFLFILTHPSLGPTLQITKRRVQATLRYCVATLLWIFTTQWFFGAPLVDRGFRWTGGACEVATDPVAMAHMSEKKQFLTASACKLNGGMWRGGHDISGHVFLLILGSAHLWMEILPAVLKAQGLNEERRVKVGSGKVVKTRSIVDGTVQTDQDRPDFQQEEFTSWNVKLAVGVVALSWWMLLMTAAYFHTWFEKFTGFIVAFLGIGLIYLVPRGIPELRAVLGMPGL